MGVAEVFDADAGAAALAAASGGLRREVRALFRVPREVEAEALERVAGAGPALLLDGAAAAASAAAWARVRTRDA